MWRADPSQILVANALDLLAGDPRGWPHTARLTGVLSVRYEAFLTQKLPQSVTLGFMLLNWVPARICAIFFCLFHSARRWSTIRQEAAAHASPNAGWSEAGMAYALGVRLGGDNYYDGQCLRGPVFNPSGRLADRTDITRSLTWMWRIAGACAGFFLLVSFFLNHFHF